MHESEQRGKLLLNGKPMPDEALARLLGLDKQIVTKTISTLLEYGVASQCPETGALMCRRMVRDENLRVIRQEAGKKGGNPVLLKQKPTTQDNQKPTTGDKQVSTPSSSSSSSVTSLSSIEERERERARGAPLAGPNDDFAGGEDLQPKLDELELALCQASGWLADRLDHNQFFGVRSAARTLRGHVTVSGAPIALTVERIGRAREFYAAQRKHAFAPSWVARDWVGLLAWIEDQEKGEVRDKGSANSNIREWKTGRAI